MKKTITTVLYIMLFVFSTGLALLSVCMGKITVAETTILPTGFSMVVGLLLVFLTVNTVGLPIAVMILDKRLLKKIIALIFVFCSLFFSFILPNMNSFCMQNYNSNLKYRQEFIDGYLSGSEKPKEYYPGRYLVSNSISSSGAVKIGRIGQSKVFVFRVNYGFSPRYVMYVSEECDPEATIMTDYPGFTLSGYRIIYRLSDKWFFVR
ncbi:MAG: hypothetical protein IJM71_01155 [Clostridia bacterium]|nr:hypothetical protein [Clostridia bacterium]